MLSLRADGVTRWTYAELWERAIEVARALRACGVGKDGRVGVLMTNRPEWLAAVFGISLAGGVAVTLSTFSTPAELDYLLQCLRRFGAVVRAGSAEEGLRGHAGRAGAGDRHGPRPARCNRRGTRSCAISQWSGRPRTPASTRWDEFLARGRDEPRELVEATAAAVRPSDAACCSSRRAPRANPKAS